MGRLSLGTYCPKPVWAHVPTVSYKERGQTMMVPLLKLTLPIEQQDCSNCSSGRNSLEDVGKELPPLPAPHTSDQSSYPRAVGHQKADSD